MTDLLLWFCVPTTLVLALIVDVVVMLGLLWRVIR